MQTGMELAQAAAPSRGESFRRELASLLNRYSMENGNDTPDFMLADYLIECLRALNTTMQVREKWYGRAPQVVSDPSEP